jgi:polyphosphate kinase
MQDILPIELRDNEDARELRPDGTYAPVPRGAQEEPFRAQKYFMAEAPLRGAQQAKPVLAVQPAPAPAPAPASPVG